MRAPNVFCLTPPIGPIAPVERDLARRDHPAAAVDVRSELLQDVECERQPRGRPTDPTQVDVDLERQLDVGSLRDADPDDRPAGLARRLDRPHGHRRDLAVAPHPEHDAVSGVHVLERAAKLLRRADRTAARAHDHVARIELGRCRRVGGNPLDERAARSRLHVEAGLLQRDGCCDLLRPCHLAQPVLVPVLERRARRHDLLLRHEASHRPAG